MKFLWFFLHGLNVATAAQSSHVHSEKKGRPEGPVPLSGKQELSQGLHDRLMPHRPDLCHMTTASWKVEERRELGNER